MTEQEDRIRTIAGYLLKNNSRLILQAPPEVAEYVKSAVLKAFNDSSIMIRNAASQDIVAFLGVLEPRNWPECLQQLVNALDASDLDRQEVSDPSTRKVPSLGIYGHVSLPNCPPSLAGIDVTIITNVPSRPRSMPWRRLVKTIHARWTSKLVGPGHWTT